MLYTLKVPFCPYLSCDAYLLMVYLWCSVHDFFKETNLHQRYAKGLENFIVFLVICAFFEGDFSYNSCVPLFYVLIFVLLSNNNRQLFIVLQRIYERWECVDQIKSIDTSKKKPSLCQPHIKHLYQT